MIRMDKQAMDILQQLLKGQQETNSRLESLEKSTGTIISEVARLREDITEVKGEIVELRKDLNLVELATANNWADIVKLKAK